MAAESKISEKYQVVVPQQIRKELGLRRGLKLRWTSLSNRQVIVEVPQKPTKGWAKRLRGLGKETWNGVDAQGYIDELRNEWNEREKNLGIR